MGYVGLKLCVWIFCFGMSAGRIQSWNLLNGFLISINEFVLVLILVLILFVDSMVMIYDKIVPTDLRGLDSLSFDV